MHHECVDNNTILCGSGVVLGLQQVLPELKKYMINWKEDVAYPNTCIQILVPCL